MASGADCLTNCWTPLFTPLITLAPSKPCPTKHEAMSNPYNFRVSKISPDNDFASNPFAGLKSRKHSLTLLLAKNFIVHQTKIWGGHRGGQDLIWGGARPPPNPPLSPPRIFFFSPFGVFFRVKRY